MKPLHCLKLTVWVLALMLITACGTQGRLGRRSGQLTKQTTSRTDKQDKQNVAQQQTAQTDGETDAEPVDTLVKEQFLQRVSDNAQHARFITSKIKFSVEVGNRQMTLTGNLKMKRDDVIRLQLMAFGFVEAGRLEFTPDYVLIVDRINKQFLKVPYAQLSFLRNSGIDFYMLQSLFWNELFQPGLSHLADRHLSRYEAEAGVDNDVVISMENKKLSYRWLADRAAALVKMSNVKYDDHFGSVYQLNWDYTDFKPMPNSKKVFPMQHKVTFTTPQKEVKFDMVLNYLGNETDWETRTELSGKYRLVSVDEILRRFMSL